MRELSTPTSPRNNSPSSNQKFADWLGLKTFGDPELEKLASGAREWAGAVKNNEPRRWLSITGTSGVGKTFVATKLYNWSRSRFSEQHLGFIPHVVYWPQFVQELRAGGAFAKRTDMISWPVLCLDDVGSERDTTGFASEELNTLLGCRMNRWTILTSNLSFDALQKIDGRITSRLIRGNNICVEVKTDDYATR